MNNLNKLVNPDFHSNQVTQNIDIDIDIDIGRRDVLKLATCLLANLLLPEKAEAAIPAVIYYVAMSALEAAAVTWAAYQTAKNVDLYYNKRTGQYDAFHVGTSPHLGSPIGSVPPSVIKKMKIDTKKEIHAKSSASSRVQTEENQCNEFSDKKVSIIDYQIYDIDRYVCSAFENENLFIDLDTHNYDIINSPEGRFMVRKIAYGSAEKRPALNIDTGQLYVVDKEDSCSLLLAVSISPSGNKRFINHTNLNSIKTFKKSKILQGKNGSAYVNEKIGSNF